MTVADQQVLQEVFTWWRHAMSRSRGGTLRAWSGLQLATQQALTLGTHIKCEAWAQMKVEMMLQPLHVVPPLLANAIFKAALRHLQDNLIAQHNAREARELAQHANHKAQEDCQDAEQTFQG